MFNIKVYNKFFVYKETISVNKLENISTFSADINGGAGNLNITLDLKIVNFDFDIGDIILIAYKNQNIYSGSVLDIEKLYGVNVENITLVLISYASLLTRVLLTQTYNTLASTIAKDLIDRFNIDYGYNLLNYDFASIPTTVGNINVVFTNKNYLDCLKQLADITGLKFYIDIDGKVNFKDRVNYNTHILTINKNIEQLKLTEEGRTLQNSLILKYNGGTQTYNDLASIATYGKKEIYIDNSSSLNNLSTANTFGANYLLNNANVIEKTQIIVNSEYDYFNIKCGDLISVRNIGYPINNLQIVKIAYDYQKAVLELEKAYSFANEVFNNN